jgi:hypothetical protein
MAGSPADDAERQADLAALVSLSTEYAAAADARDGERFAALFVEEGELVVPKFPTDLRPVVIRCGHAELRQVPDGLRRYDRTFHQVSNHQITLEGDRAEGVVQCTAHHASARSRNDPSDDAEGTDLVWFIRYHDTYRRTDTGWRFVRRVLDLQWVEEHPIVRMGVPADE